MREDEQGVICRRLPHLVYSATKNARGLVGGEALHLAGARADLAVY